MRQIQLQVLLPLVEVANLVKAYITACCLKLPHEIVIIPRGCVSLGKNSTSIQSSITCIEQQLLCEHLQVYNHTAKCKYV